MAYRVGQKVVCIDARPSSRWSRQWLRKGSIYTIERILPTIRSDLQDHHNSPFGFDLVEAPGKTNGFGGLRFRPVVERKTDISIFTKMLTDNRVVA